jgi:hypothetical protein
MEHIAKGRALAALRPKLPLELTKDAERDDPADAAAVDR